MFKVSFRNLCVSTQSMSPKQKANEGAKTKLPQTKHLLLMSSFTEKIYNKEKASSLHC